LDEHSKIDITIDGADEVDPLLRLIKAAEVRCCGEKIIATASKKMCGGRFEQACSRTRQVPVPVEIIPFAGLFWRERSPRWRQVCKQRTRADGTAFVTDEGHHILDCNFERSPILPAGAPLSDMPGVSSMALHWNCEARAGGKGKLSD